MTIKCIIVDDEPVARKVIREYINQIGFLELVGEAENPLKASSFLSQYEIKLVFLDIHMPKMSGITFLRTSNSFPLTIITTAYPEHALEGFELDILDYLVKPISLERFLKACNKARQFLKIDSNSKESSDNYFFVKCNSIIEKIEYDSLYYIEAIDNYVILHLKVGKLISYLTLKTIVDHLPTSKFIRVHKSFAVNVSKIKNIEGNVIRLETGTIPISQSLKSEVMQFILGDKIIKR